MSVSLRSRRGARLPCDSRAGFGVQCPGAWQGSSRDSTRDATAVASFLPKRSFLARADLSTRSGLVGSRFGGGGVHRREINRVITRGD